MSKVGIKSASDNSLLCYCFGVSRSDVLHNPSIKEYVVEQTKQGNVHVRPATLQDAVA